jgi:hypothetical protein
MHAERIKFEAGMQIEQMVSDFSRARRVSDPDWHSFGLLDERLHS